MPINKRVEEQLRMIRLTRNLSLEALSDELSISVSTLSNLERGETEMTITRLADILKYLQLDFVDFFVKLEDANEIKMVFQSPKEAYGIQQDSEKNILNEIHLLKKEIEALKNNRY